MLLATAIVDIQNKSVRTPAVTIPRDTTHFCYKKTTVWNPIKPLLGSGTRGAILHDSRATRR